MADKREAVRTDDPDLVAETKISRIMAGLEANDREAVVAWFTRKYIRPVDGDNR